MKIGPYTTIYLHFHSLFLIFFYNLWWYPNGTYKFKLSNQSSSLIVVIIEYKSEQYCKISFSTVRLFSAFLNVTQNYRRKSPRWCLILRKCRFQPSQVNSLRKSCFFFSRNHGGVTNYSNSIKFFRMTPGYRPIGTLITNPN